MDQYKISQNPGSNKKGPKKQPPNNKLRNRSASRLLSPQLVIGGIIGATLLVAVGVFAATHFADKLPIPGAKTTTKKSGAKTSDGAITGDAFNDVTNAITNKKPGDLKAYYAKTVHVVIPGQTINQNVDGSKVESLIGDILNGAQNPWDWHPSPSQLAAWQQGPYGQYFEGDVIVGISDDGIVVVITFDDSGQIVTIFIAPVGDLTTPTAPTGGGGTTPTDPGSDSTGVPSTINGVDDSD